MTCQLLAVLDSLGSLDLCPLLCLVFEKLSKRRLGCLRWNKAEEKNVHSGIIALLDRPVILECLSCATMTNNEFDNVFLVFTRIGEYMCTYINICINKRFLTRNFECCLFDAKTCIVMVTGAFR